MCLKLSNLTSLPCFHSLFQLHHDQSSTLHRISFFPKMFLFVIIMMSIIFQISNSLILNMTGDSYKQYHEIFTIALKGNSETLCFYQHHTEPALLWGTQMLIYNKKEHYHYHWAALWPWAAELQLKMKL